MATFYEVKVSRIKSHARDLIKEIPLQLSLG